MSARRRRMPLPAMIVLVLACGLLVPLLLITNGEDAERSASTTAVMLPGGEEGWQRTGFSSTRICRDAPLEFTVDGERYRETVLVSGGECLAQGSRELEVRYDPDDPRDVTPLERQYVLYGFVAVFLVATLATLVVLLRRSFSRRS